MQGSSTAIIFNDLLEKFVDALPADLERSGP
jgi:hypothetical protein